VRPGAPMPDASGVEALPGETDAEYVARQTQLREEAAARMRAKFGGSGGLNGRMGGVGSGGCGSNSGSGASTGEVLAGIGSAAGSAASVAASGLGTVAATGFSATSWLVGKARQSAGTVVSSVVARSSSGQHLGSSAEPAEEESNDISDLLASARVDGDRHADPPQASTTSAFGGEAAVRTGAVGPSSKAKRDVDFFAAAGFDAPPAASPSVTRENTPTSALDSLGKGPRGDEGMGGEAAISSPSTHVSNHASTPSSQGLSARKKVVAKKGGGDAGWDDFDTW
jgi:hypothetical protein